MKQFATICALVGTLVVSGCNNSNSQDSYNNKIQSGEYTFNLEQYVINDGKNVKSSEFGKLISKQKGNFNLINGSQEKGTMEIYDFDGNGYPDVMVTRRANGAIVSIGLDYGSSNYNTLKKKLGNRVSIYQP